MNTGLSLKANVSDVSRTIAEISSQIDSKISFDDLQLVMKDFVQKSDMQYFLSSKVSLEEMRSMLENRSYSQDLRY